MEGGLGEVIGASRGAPSVARTALSRVRGRRKRFFCHEYPQHLLFAEVLGLHAQSVRREKGACGGQILGSGSGGVSLR